VGTTFKTEQDFKTFIESMVGDQVSAAVQAALTPLLAQQTTPAMARMLQQQQQPAAAQTAEQTSDPYNFAAYEKEYGIDALLSDTQWLAERHNPARQRKAEQGSIMVARFARAVGGARHDAIPPAQWAVKNFGPNDPVTKVLSAGDPAAGGMLVPPGWYADLIEFLRPMSIVRRMNPIILPMPVGSLTMPKLAGGATASYIGENRAAVLTQPEFGDLTLVRKKLAALVPISNDLLRYSSPAADVVVRDDLVAAMAQRSDKAFIRDDGTVYTPKGIRNWTPAANLIPANATESLQNTTTDLGKLIVALKGKNVRMLRPGWMFSVRTEQYLLTKQTATGQFAFREEMLRGTFWGMPYGVTTQILDTGGVGGNESEIYLVDFADVVIGESLNLLIDVSMEAAYEDNSGNVISAFSRDQTVVRAIQEHDLGMRHDFSSAILTNVLWGT
jgi:HK97 family phage major capsid protein